MDEFHLTKIGLCKIRKKSFFKTKTHIKKNIENIIKYLLKKEYERFIEILFSSRHFKRYLH